MSKEFTKVERYNQYEIETKDVFLLYGLGAFAAPAFKYLDRCGAKDTVESNLNKTLYYLKQSVGCNALVPQIAFPAQVEVRQAALGLINPATNQYLNKIGLESDSGYFIHQLTEAVIQDRTTGGNHYTPAMSLLLNGRFDCAYNILRNLMNHFGIKIYE